MRRRLVPILAVPVLAAAADLHAEPREEPVTPVVVTVYSDYV